MVEGTCGIHWIHLAGFPIAVFTIAAVQELAIAEIEIHLQPVFGERHSPEIIRSDVYLRNRLGIRALHERTAREQVIAQHGFFFTTAYLQEERLLKIQVGVTLLQVQLMVGMHGGDGIHSPREKSFDNACSRLIAPRR